MARTKNTKRQLGRAIVSVVMLVTIAALAVWYVRGHAGEFRRILEIDPVSFAILSVLCTLAIWVSGLQMNAIVTIFGTRITLWEGFGLSAINTMANFYFTKAGLAAKGVYLKKRHDFEYSHFVSSLAGAYVVSMIAQGASGLIFYSMWAVRHGTARWEFILIFAGLTFGGFIPLLVPGLRVKTESGFLGKVKQVMDGWDQVRRHYRVLFLIALLNLVYALIGGLRLYVSYRSVGYDVDVLSAFVMAPLATVTMITSVTPGAIGIRQALVGYGSELLGIGMTEGIVAATVDHAAGTLWVFVFGIVFAVWIWMAGRKAAS